MTKAWSRLAHNNEHRKRGRGIKDRKKGKKRGEKGKGKVRDHLKPLTQGKVIDKKFKLLQMAIKTFKRAWETLQTLFW